LSQAKGAFSYYDTHPTLTPTGGSGLSSASSPNATWPPGHVTSSSLGAQADRPASLLPSVPGCWRRGTAGPLQDRGPQEAERSWTDLQARARGRPRVGRGFLGHVDNRQ